MKKENYVENYQALASYYDELLGDFDNLEKIWLKYFLESSKGNKTLELACGTGYFSNLLAKKGYTVFASDISKEMIEFAKSRYDDKNLEFGVIDMSNFKIRDVYDNVVCICDSINYLNLVELDKMFDCVNKSLKSNGLFFFDFHNQKRLSEFEDEYIEEGYLKDVGYQFTILSDISNRTLNTNFIFFKGEEQIFESHNQFVHSDDEIKKLLEKYNFEYKIVDNFIKDEKKLVIGVKR